MTATEQRQRRVRGAESFDRALIVAVFALGVGGLVILRFVGAPAFIPILFAAGLLCIYAVVATLNSLSKLEPETIGDNCYYLGFLFTLTSLGVTLYALSGPEIGIGLQRDIIAGFGVALSSTVVGMFLRLLLMQIRTDIVARDREARRDLLVVTREFRSTLAAAIAEVKAFSTESVQLAAETNDRIRAAANSALDEQKAAAKVTGEAYHNALQASLRETSAALAEDIRDSLRTPLAETTRALQTALGEFTSVVEGQTVAQRDAGLNMQVEATQLLAANKAIRSETESFAEALGAARSQIDGLGRVLEHAAERLAPVSESSGETTLGKTDVAAMLAAFEQRIETAGRSLDETASALERCRTALEARAETLEAETGRRGPARWWRPWRGA